MDRMNFYNRNIVPVLRDVCDLGGGGEGELIL